MWNVRIGDKVTLIKPMKAGRNNAITLPEMGLIYTVREAVEGYNEEVGFLPAIRLVEIINPIQHVITGPGVTGHCEVKFTLRCFRPVQTHKGMETLRSLLNDPTKTIRETNPLDTRKVKTNVT